MKTNDLVAAGKTAVPLAQLPPTGRKLSRHELEFGSKGPLSELFGSMFKQQDSYARVCRMPRPPMLLADRVAGIAGEPGSMKTGIVWTETDVKADAWYLHNGHMPMGLVAEPQADLLLISWLGADFHNRSERVYRLLGCELTFHSLDMPKAGETIRYQIHIDAHAQVGGTKLFYFGHDAYVGARLLSSVRNGLAGFFSDAELAKSSGIRWSAQQDQPKQDVRLDPPRHLTNKRIFSTAEIEAFTHGDAFACFGNGFETAATHTRTPNTNKGRLRLFDRIVEFDPHGGPWRRGYMRAECDVPKDAWFYQCHFHNDPCMPAVLIREAAMQVLEFYMAALGFTIERDGWIFGPTTEEAHRFIHRSQITPDRVHVVSYEIFIEEIIGGDRPKLYAALLARCDGHNVFVARRFGISLVPDWPFYERYASTETVSPKRIVSPTGDVPGDYGSLLASALGKPGDAFGSLYRHLDNGERMVRMPSPPFHFISWIASTDCQPGLATPEGKLVAEYEVPPDAWYFKESGTGKMPFAILMEVVLQPCGWFANYMGLFAQSDLSFRNLDGSQAKILQVVTPQTGTLSTVVTFKRHAQVGTTTIVFFEIVCHASSGVVMTLHTSFGYFPPEALANQRGLPVSHEEHARIQEPSDVRLGLDAAGSLRGNRRAPLPSGQLDLIDEITGYCPHGGRAGLGRIRGRQTIDPRAWYFKAHFFQDPVQPGSIGIEGLFILAKAAALLQKLDAGFGNPRFDAPSPSPDHNFGWKFRGQVLPSNREVTSEVEISEIVRGRDAVTLCFEGSLWVDGIRIYEIQDAVLCIREGDKLSDGPAIGRERLIDLAAEPWLYGHCPTYQIPAFPMFGVVAALLATSKSTLRREKLVSLNNLEISRWIRLDGGPVRLQFKQIRTDGNRQWIEIWSENNEGPVAQSSRVGRAIEFYSEDYPTPPALWSPPQQAVPVPKPYEHGGYFHTREFARAEGMARDRTSSVLELDIEPALKAANDDTAIFLDITAHGIPYAETQLWFHGVPQGHVAVPYRIEACGFFADLPSFGRARVVTRPVDLPTPRTPRCAVQVQHDGRVIIEYVLLLALVPIPGRDLRARYWRDFLQHDRVAPGGHLARFEPGCTKLSIDELKTINWFPGTVERLYRISGDFPAVVEAVALKDHFGRRLNVHPANVRLEGEVVRIQDKVLNLSEFVRRRWGANSVFEVTDTRPQDGNWVLDRNSSPELVSVASSHGNGRDSQIVGKKGSTGHVGLVELVSSAGYEIAFIKKTVLAVADDIFRNQALADDLVNDVEAETAGLSPDAERLWRIDVANGGDTRMTINVGAEAEGVIDPQVMENAIRRLILEQPVLRRCYPEKNGRPTSAPIRSFLKPMAYFSDLTHVEPGRRRDAAFDIVREVSKVPFDVERGPLFRIDILRLEPTRYLLYATMHHIISDVRSLMTTVVRLLDYHSRIQRGESEIEPVSIAPASAPATGVENDAESRGFWKQLLPSLDFTPLFSELGDPVRPLRPAGSIKLTFTTELWQAVNLRAPKVVTLAAYRLLLAELSGRRSFVIGVPMLRVSQDDYYGIGFSGVPTLLEGGIDQNWSLDELLADTRGKLKQATQHGQIPLIDIQALLEQAGSTEIAQPSALFSVSLLPFARRVGDFAITHAHSIERAHTDLLFAFWVGIAEGIGEYAIRVEYDRSYFDRFDMQALLARYIRLLEILTKPAANPKLAEIMAAQDRAQPPRQLRVHISANFTCDPIVEPLQHFAGLLDWPLRIELGGYNQVLQDLQNPSSPLSRNERGANVVLLRLEDWIRDRADRADLLSDAVKMEQQLLALAEEYTSTFADALSATRVPLLVSVLPASEAMLEDESKRLALGRVEAKFRIGLESLRGIHVLKWDETVAHMPVAVVSDEFADRLGHVPYSNEAFAAMGAALGRRLHEVWRRPFKVIVVDCDNTLWQGVVGEDDIAGLTIDERHRSLQAALVRASRAGLLICLCSKNNEAEVLAVFREHPDMVLDLEHVVSWRINWQTKSHNIMELARDLDLGLDSFVFLDDSPIEIDEVSSACPEVTSIQVPTEGPAARFADHLWPLDRSYVTNEDEARTELYRQATQREDARRRSTNYAAFLASLRLQVTIETPQADAVERVSQLTGRTNQFNCCPEERGFAEILRRIADPNHTLKAVHVEDRFGSYGLVGVLGARAVRERLEADTFLMSCRVLGRGVEYRMVNALGAMARQRSLAQVAILFKSTGRNMPAERFLDSIAEAKREPLAAGGLAYVLTTGVALNLSVSVDVIEVKSEESSKPASVASKHGLIAPVSGYVFARIASEFASAEAVLRASTPRTRVPTASAHRADAGESAANQDPASGDAAWQNAAELIRKIFAERFGMADPDFSAPPWRLGLTSLKTVQFLAELRRIAKVTIEIKDVHDAASLSDLARRLSDLQEGRDNDRKSNLTTEMIATDLTLPRDIVPTRVERRINLPDERRKVLLTGATGFLGGHLVTELIARTDTTVRCIVRAPDEAAAIERLAISLEAGGHRGALDALGTRLHALAGDLGVPHFGWSNEVFRATGADTDLVLHNGALVDFMAPYPQLRGPNVLGTLHVLAFANEASAPFHFVSTAAVFDADSWLGVDLVAESELPETPDDLLHGYSATKWVSERHIRTARARGLPGVIYRPGNICGDSSSGIWPPGDAITRIVRAVFDIGALPDVPLRIDLAPVDYVARAIVTLAMMRPLANDTYHILNSQRMCMEEFRRLIPEWQTLPVVAPEAWLNAARRLAETNPDHPIAGFVPVLLEPVGRRKLSFFEFLARRPNLSDAHARRSLAAHDVRCPKVDSAMFGRFISHWEAYGHLRTRQNIAR